MGEMGWQDGRADRAMRVRMKRAASSKMERSAVAVSV